MSSRMQWLSGLPRSGGGNSGGRASSSRFGHQAQQALLHFGEACRLVQLAVQVGGGVQQFDAQLGVVGKALVDAGHRPVQQVARGCLAFGPVARQARITGGENAEQKIFHAFGPPGLGLRLAGLPGHAGHARAKG